MTQVQYFLKDVCKKLVACIASVACVLIFVFTVSRLQSITSPHVQHIVTICSQIAAWTLGIALIGVAIIESIYKMWKEAGRKANRDQPEECQ